jgi:hypothetical protein
MGLFLCGRIRQRAAVLVLVQQIIKKGERRILRKAIPREQEVAYYQDSHRTRGGFT